jgi:hypothetical protein
MSIKDDLVRMMIVLIAMTLISCRSCDTIQEPFPTPSPTPSGTQ